MRSLAALVDRWRALRDRCLTSPAFRAFATAFPPTRPEARRRARALFDLVAGFVYSQVLLACVRLGVFDALRDGPRTVAELSPRFGLDADATRTLLRAATALQLTEDRGPDRYGLGALGAAVVGNAGITAMVEHHALLYRDLADPVELLRRGQARAGGDLAGYWPYAAEDGRPAGVDPAAAAPYTALMAASQPLVSEEVLAAYPLGQHRCLLDVGGGDGSFLRAAGGAAPALRLVLFDLPAVAPRARERFAAAGLADRAEVVTGDFFADPLPRGADIASLVRVLHDHDDARVARLLDSVYAALPPGGTLLVAEPLAGTRGAERMGDAYFGLYLFAMGRGRPRTLAELGALLTAAGFVSIEQRNTRIPLQTSLVIARKPR